MHNKTQMLLYKQHLASASARGPDWRYFVTFLIAYLVTFEYALIIDDLLCLTVTWVFNPLSDFPTNSHLSHAVSNSLSGLSISSTSSVTSFSCISTFSPFLISALRALTSLPRTS